MFTPVISLRRAERETGISRQTLKRWLAREGIVLPQLGRGCKVFIPVVDIERVIWKRTAKVNWSVIRKAG